MPSAILFCLFGIFASKMSAKIKDIRLEAKLTQAQAASYVGVPLRTYIRYEHDYPGVSEIKREYIIKRLQNLTEISEEKGILSLDTIQRIISEICTKHSIQLCYLFGSYAKGYASDKSDVDLLIDTDITGLDFFGLIEEFRDSLHKKVDLLRLDDIKQNKDLLLEILKDGIKLYSFPLKSQLNNV